MGEEYSTASRGTLKLKGVHDGKVTKAKRKKERPKDDGGSGLAVPDDGDGDAALARVEADAQGNGGDRAARDTGRAEGDESKDLAESGPRGNDEDNEGPLDGAGKTEAQLRHEAQRRRRLEDRLKREGIKTHKERVEELNRYLSGLSEHHDMPRIGPG